ncbi:hypothetical protein AIGOOFII_3561 [Methylobacterium marchantiae]|nr:hypothetical protein AIGOOFII_3561 [Methylobacterium marchantiae]
MTAVLTLGSRPLSHIGSPLIGTRSCGGRVPTTDRSQEPRGHEIKVCDDLTAERALQRDRGTQTFDL